MTDTLTPEQTQTQLDASVALISAVAERGEGTNA